MKTSISAYSFLYEICYKGETQLSVILKAKDLGFDAIEFTDLTPPDGISKIEYANMLRNEAERVGVEISAYSVFADLISGSDGDLDAEIKRIKEQIDVAECLGVKLFRHDATFSIPTNVDEYDGFLSILDRLADGCRRITEYAQTKGIKTMIENHGKFCQDSERIVMIVKRVAHKNFGIQLDFGNFLCVDENPADAVKRCAPYAFNAHAKDFIFKAGEDGYPGEEFLQTRGQNYIRGTVLGHGVVPIKQCFEILKESGYDGYLTLEFEGYERTDFALEKGMAYLNRLLNNNK